MSERECHCGCGTFLTSRQRKWATPQCQKKDARAKWILKVYGITMEEYDLILEAQDGKCGCCGKPFKPGVTPHIDHEHSKGGSGHVRGIVHPYCNINLIGRLKDHAVAQALANYLLNPPAVQVLGVRIAPGRPKKKRQPRKRSR